MRLFKKFYPNSYFSHPEEINLDSIYLFMKISDQSLERKLYDESKDSVSCFKEILGKSLAQEHNKRVLIFPDIGCSLEEPFICASNRFFERIEEGRKRLAHPKEMEFIDGCSDILIIFEHSKKMILIDHEGGYIIVNPNKKEQSDGANPDKSTAS